MSKFESSLTPSLIEQTEENIEKMRMAELIVNQTNVTLTNGRIDIKFPNLTQFGDNFYDKYLHTIEIKLGNRTIPFPHRFVIGNMHHTFTISNPEIQNFLNTDNFDKNVILNKFSMLIDGMSIPRQQITINNDFNIADRDFHEDDILSKITEKDLRDIYIGDIQGVENLETLKNVIQELKNQYRDFPEDTQMDNNRFQQVNMLLDDAITQVFHVISKDAKLTKHQKSIKFRDICLEEQISNQYEHYMNIYTLYSKVLDDDIDNS